MGETKIQRPSKEELEQYYEIEQKDRLSPEDILNGTVLVSNISSTHKNLRGKFSLLEVVPPQVLVIGISALQKQPGVYMDQDGTEKIGIRVVLPMLLAFDHRPLDYAHLMPFIMKMDEIIADPQAFFEKHK